MTSKTIPPATISPGRGIGLLTLGLSLHNVLTRVKAHPQTYPAINLSYSPSAPLYQPVTLWLPENGLRLQFDGPDQRLRLIEVLDFSKTPLIYKSQEVVKVTRVSDQGPSHGPTFRHAYRLFGPTYPGEYIPPSQGMAHGIYVLSYPGVAFSFPLVDGAWSKHCDFVSLMSSSAAGLATSMSLFQGASWPEARNVLFTRTPTSPRSNALIGKNKEVAPLEIDEARIHGGGKIELIRRSAQSAGPSFWMTLSETTPQDLIAELGPPDAIYRRKDKRIGIHGGRLGSPTVGILTDPTDIDPYSESSLSDDDSDEEGSPAFDGNAAPMTPDCFYNYFNHGFDVFISHPKPPSPSFPGSFTSASQGTSQSQLTVTKILIHGNVPGSYPFNRHRRLRWMLDIPSSTTLLNSETPYNVISDQLKQLWKDYYDNQEEEASSQRGMVLNRGWGDSPGSSVDFLGDWEESGRPAGTEGGQALGNTELFGFPGSLFEVLKNGAVSCLTIY